MSPAAAKKTIPDLLADEPGLAAITGPSRKALTRGELAQLVEGTRGSLRRFGIAPADAVAMVVPNGPEMAAAFVAVASSAIAAPLNAAYRADEFDFYLGDLNAKALLVQAGLDTPSRMVAARRNIPVIELAANADRPAGSFTLS